MQVEEILRKKGNTIITIKPQQTIQEAAQLLAEKRIGAVLVVDDTQKPIGILSERDIVRELGQRGTSVVNEKVETVMTKDLIIALPEDELSYLSNTMTNKRIRHLPVMHNGKLVGMVSIGDVVKAQLDYFEGEALTLRQYIAGGYA
jgi:CBS domain-containing protein